MKRVMALAGDGCLSGHGMPPGQSVDRAAARHHGSEGGDALSIEELLTPTAFPHPITQLELRETHLSWLVLTGTVAYKIKKPVRFEFIDAGTLERRRLLCEEELRLNRRLAPEIYLQVVPIVRTEGGVSIGGTGKAIEYAVAMQQFPAGDELPRLLTRADVEVNEMSALGELLAEFHGKAPTSSAARAPDRQYESVLGNLTELVAHLGPLEPPPGLRRIIAWAREQVQALEPTFRLRERSGFVRECHGDLHAANIVRWNHALVPFDCLEFEPQLRWIDVINDVAFLVMDLVSHERQDLAFALLSRYLEVTGDYDGIGLLPFYAAYRALVRAKVDALTAEQIPARAGDLRNRLHHRVAAAASWMSPHQASLILMHGPSGAGKSWLSERLVPRLRAVRIRSDVERRRLAGTPAGSTVSGVRQGIYSAQFSHRTYGRLADCAESCLRAGFSAIVDATFLEAADRELFRALARHTGANLVIVSCQSDPVTLSRRVLERSTWHTDAADASLAILDTQLREFAPFTLAEQSCVIAVDTCEPHAVQRVATAIEARSSG